MSIHLRYSFLVGIVLVWSLMGFPLLASSANALGMATSEIIIAVRAGVALLCAILIAFSLKNHRSLSSINFRVLLLFFGLYTLRIAFDTTFNPASLRQPSYHYWAFAIGVSLLPALTLSLLARHLDFSRIFNPLMVIGIVVLSLAIIFGSTTVQNTTGATYDTGRLALESINPISLGHVGATVFLLVYWRLRLLAFNFVTFMIWLAAALLGLYGVLASGSRGPLVAMICGILFFEVVKGGRTLIFLSILSAPILAVLTLDISQIETTLGTNIFSRFGTALSGSDASSLARVEQLGSAWALFLDHPLLGAQLEDPAYGIYPHNIVIEAFMALGIFGGVLLLTLLATTGVRAFRLARSNPTMSAYGALFVQYMVAAQLSGGLYGSSAMWALIGCIAGTRLPQVMRKAHQKPGAHFVGQKPNTVDLPPRAGFQSSQQLRANSDRTGTII